MGREKGQSSRLTTTTKTPAPKLERKYIEKNRRNHLKSLYTDLFSLLPAHQMQERMALPDQLDETVKYIKCLENQLEKSRQKKEELLQKSRKTPNSSSCRNCIPAAGEQTEPPEIQVVDTSPGMSVVLINGLESISQFYGIIRVLHKQQGLQVTNATFQIHGNSTLQVAHEQVGKSEMGMIAERLKVVIKGCPGGEAIESEPLNSWDNNYDIERDNLGFPVLEQFLVQCQNPPPSFFWTAGNEYYCAQN
ncbi:PREDICTED: uncharacterized protein LOC109167721 isoform X1 [Ipomoea nil]|uniref:uncharacterized protein LOC109167721 isoform X1 n=1 Tax=Ipomoea nil TaxID=35883 RepID=UPI000900E5B2|nr:PREDICTED: uncharacterized protein LOC109167721 isoform X1 [Ipomoea nil]